MLANGKAASGFIASVLSPAWPVICFGLGLVWATLGSLGGELSTDTGDYSVENWQLEAGLPQISITSIAQTPDGYLWLGTFNGLVRFDGVRFAVYDEGNTPRLGSNGIRQLEVGGDGALWILTMTDTVVRMAAGEFTALSREDALPTATVSSLLLQDPNRRVLLFDGRGDLLQFEKGHLRPVDRQDPLQTGGEPCLLTSSGGGTAFVVTRGKIMRSLPVIVAPLTDSGSKTSRIDVVNFCATPSQSGGYWLGSSNGIYRVEQWRLPARVVALPPGVKDLSFLREDGQGNLWAAGSSRVCRWDSTGLWQQFSSETGLTGRHVTYLFRDREGCLWVGTGQFGLYRFRPHVFRVYHTEAGMSSDVVTSVTQGPQGQMWFGVNGGGLHAWASGKLKPVTEPSCLQSYPLAYSVLADHQGAVWVGLYGEKAVRLEAGVVTLYNIGDQSSRLMTPQALFEDHSGIIWLGCAHSLLRYEGGQFTRYTCGEGLSCDSVVALAEDHSGGLYVGTDGGGLNCLRNGRFTAWRERDGLADNHVSSLYVDKEDRLWIGTVNGGLARFKDGRFANVTISDGLPSNTIGALIEDGFGYLWLGSNRGIIRVNYGELNNYADGDRRPLSWHIYGLSDGLGSIGCTDTGQPACCKARDGKLWFATIKGVAVVDPHRLPFNSLPPPVVIEQVVMDDQVYDLQSAGPGPPMLTVPPRAHRVEFHFTGLSLVAPERVRFRYRLGPFDHDWTEAGTRRVAYYTGIPPGKYEFQVTACNNDAEWNEEGVRLGLVVLPSWWMTWWFRGLMALGVAGLVLGWYEQRLHRLRRERLAQESFSRRLIASQEQERRRLAGELHDGLGQDLLVIASEAQLSLSRAENPPATAARLKDIAETARQALQQARHMAHNLRPGLLDELGFTKAVRASADKAAQACGISMVVCLADVDGLLPPEFEVNLFRIVQECLNNVLKHAQASEAKLTLMKEPSVLRLIVEDNGRGFAPGRPGPELANQTGFGLRQIAERARMMGGRVDIRSQPGQGTRLTVEVPLIRTEKAE
jgi:signal transduction histidine kinase/ligand-binding sensor domain-containing protein